MGAGLVVVTVAAAAVVAALVVLVALRRRDRHALAAARADTERLQERLEALAARMEAERTGPSSPPATRAEFVITNAGDEHAPASTTTAARGVSAHALLPVLLGEPLLRTWALSHGVRRALSASSRNRIRFEMRREVKRARRRRRTASRVRDAG